MQEAKEKTPFDDFQLEEYKNISNSHFESIKQVSIFFRYYLLILAAPFLLFNFIVGTEGGLKSFFQGNNDAIYYNIVFIYLFLVSLIGLFIFYYVVNLRHDAILYARAVNKVRRYFYEGSNLGIEDYEQYLALPIVSTRPKYSQRTFFSPLVVVFSIINCGLFFAAFSIKFLNTPYFGQWGFNFDLPLSKINIAISTFLFFAFHVGGYYYLSYFRNVHYLKHYSFGVDIDGVLNDQTTHFVSWIRKMTGKEIRPEEIKEIPVNLNEGLGISDFEERLVFNTKEYWMTLPEKPGAAKRINEFQKRFGYNIFFFSYRDWPQYGTEEKKIRDIIIEKKLTPLEKNEISKITTNWLKSKGIEAVVVKDNWSTLKYSWNRLFKGIKKVVIEMGNPYISDTRYWNRFRRSIRSKNRFQGANLKGFRFFIEDTPENAIKLSSLCDYVFMFDEPYNKEIVSQMQVDSGRTNENRKTGSGYIFPKNVIRVYNWNDIYRHLKSLS
jgi:uncharacterized HAD superfamily protein